jgi:hypothetical protein
MLSAAILSILASSIPLLASASSASVATTVPQTDSAGTVWLCRPRLANNPCDGSMATTTVTATGVRSVQADTASGSRRYNCFYLYPTASNESTTNSDLTVQPAETSNATAQAARFSSVCNVWAPMYRQITVRGLTSANGADPAAYTVAYNSVLADWKDFIAHYDDGYPIIFIGHSQGSVMLIKLLRAEVDKNPKMRKQMVDAIIVGGNVTVPTGKTVGSTFKNLPLCTASKKSGCIIA